FEKKNLSNLQTFSTRTLDRLAHKEKSLSQLGTSLRLSYIQLNSSLFSKIKAQEQQSLELLNLDLFDDLEVEFYKTKTISHSNKMFTWIGEILEDPWSSAVLTFDENGVVGNINIEGRVYFIGQIGEGLHFVSEGNRSKIAEDELRPMPTPPVNSAVQPKADTFNDGSFVDIMFLYTADALAAEPTIETEITNTVEFTNASLARSCGLFRLRHVHTEQVVYDESLSNSDLLSCMATTGDGCLDIVDTLRSTHGADIVSMWQAAPVAIGYIPDAGTSNPAAGFNAISPGSGITSMTFTHEVGHNFGINHDRYSEDLSLNDYNAPKGFAYDYVDIDNNFSTNVARGGSCALADRNCFYSGYYSNPRILKNGFPLGKAGIADGVATLNSMRVHLGNYAQATSAYSPDLSGCKENAKKVSSTPQCFISTATFGSSLHPYVLNLRKFRDEYLNNSRVGRSLVDFYYQTSPSLANVIAENMVLKNVSRFLLTPIIFAIVDPGKFGLLFLGICLLAFAPYRRLKKYV
ncbi:MAG: CFI-box-CTERM domain-containing protein, partial [Pseudobdellovibrionaceae bacterium]